MAGGGVKRKMGFSNSVQASKNLTHKLRKRCPPHLRHPNDIYVSNKSNFQGQISQCEKLINEDESEIVLHGIGAAIEKTINLALRLKEKHEGTVDLHVETSTVALVDDCEPLTDSEDYESQTRQNSAIHVRVVRRKDSPL